MRQLAASICLSLGLMTATLANSAPTEQAPEPNVGTLGASLDPVTALAGRYRLDPAHTSVVARISHRGVSITTVRFGKSSGILTWDPVRADKIGLEAEVETGSFTSPVEFRILPTGEGFLDVAKFPKAKFVSTSVELNAPRRARIIGDLTLRGVTRPVVIDAELVGAKATQGEMAIGFSGAMKLRRSNFGSTSLPTGVGDEVELVLDVEFVRKAGAP